MTRAAEIAARIAEVRGRIEMAARRAGRDPAAITLLSVGKTKPLPDLLSAYGAGIRHFGENRVQEAEAKYPQLPPDAVRHLIGTIQSNKANRAAKLADIVQTVDSIEIAGRLDRAAASLGKKLTVLIEVKLGGEATKGGVSPEELSALAAAVRALPSLTLTGLMTIPPPGEGAPHFARLRALAEALALGDLSMGMSDDFEEAIAEGATIVRVGSAIFGPRS